jgi:hypothetical protein
MNPRPRVLRFTVLLSALACLSLLAPAVPASAFVDQDADHMDDAWESGHGLNPAEPADGDQDPDGDRLANRDEFFADTDPQAHTGAAAITDRQLLRLFQGKAFLYFWEASAAPYFFTPDGCDFNLQASCSANFNSIATTGFGLLSYVIADHYDWVGHQAAYDRIHTLLARIAQLQGPAFDLFNPADPLNTPPTQSNRHGYLYHFVNDQGHRVGPDTEISTVDHSFLVAGAAVAGEYYKGTEVAQLAEQIAHNTDWDWLWDGTYLWQSWHEDPEWGEPEWGVTAWDGGAAFDHWNRYSELIALMMLAMGHPDPEYAIDNGAFPNAWDQLTRDFGNNLTNRIFPREYAHVFPGNPAPNTQPESFGFEPNMPSTINDPGFVNSATELHYIHAGSLHNHQYAHMLVDLRRRRDRYGADFFNNSVAAAMVNRRYTNSLRENAYGGDPGSPDPYLVQPYETYSLESWGLMAGVAQFGYATMQPIIIAGEDFSPGHLSLLSDSGTVVLNAPLGSTEFVPGVVLDFLRNMLTRFQAQEPGYDGLIGRYGFRNAFNLGRTHFGQLGHFPAQTLGLDLGPVVAGVDGHLQGLIWKFMLRNADMRRGMEAAGFATNAVDPFILNFDDNPPFPHQDPNGGGADPNSFGGFSFGFAGGQISYVDIGDPFPELPYGPQQWAQRISCGDDASGAFITLRDHSANHADTLSFWIRGENGGEQFLLGLKDDVLDRTGHPLAAVEVKLPLSTFGTVTNGWTGIQVPLEEFARRGVRLTELDNISFTCSAPAGGTIYIDDIAFLGDGRKPQPPANVDASTDGFNATISWDASPEADVVGYRVYRAIPQNPTPELLTPTLVVGTSFTDTTADRSLPNQWHVTAVDHAQPQNESDPSASVAVAINAAPVFGPIPDQAVEAGQLLTFDVSATDPNGDAIELSMPSKPAAATFTDHGDGTGTFSWTPAPADVGAVLVTFQARDMFPAPLSTTEDVVITVSAPPAPINRPPRLTTPPLLAGRTVFEDFDGQSQVNVWWDSDPGVFTRTATPVATDGGAGMRVEFNKNGLAFAFFASEPRQDGTANNFAGASRFRFWIHGNVELLVKVEDTAGGFYEQRVDTQTADPDDWEPAIVDLAQAVNMNLGAIRNVLFFPAPGQPTATGAFTVDGFLVQRDVLLAAVEGQPFQLTVQGTDLDGDALTRSLAPLPAGAAFNAATGVFSWTPAANQLGEHGFRAAVSDSLLEDFETASILVEGRNLVLNPSFELGKAAWEGWGNQQNEQVTTETAFDGAKSLKLRLGRTPREIAQLIRPVTAGTEYLARVAIKPQGVAGGGQAYCELIWRKNNGATIRVDSFGHSSGTGDWSPSSLSVVAPPLAARVRIRLVTSAGTGVAYFDDVRLQRLP